LGVVAGGSAKTAVPPFTGVVPPAEPPLLPPQPAATRASASAPMPVASSPARRLLPGGLRLLS
jgi:hypothetical protein